MLKPKGPALDDDSLPKPLAGDLDADPSEAKLANKETDINEMKWESDVPEVREQHALGKKYYDKTPYHPEIHFIDADDLEGHTRARLKKEDVPSIDIHVIKKGTGRVCLAPEWASVNYRAYDKNELRGEKAQPDELIAWGTKAFSLGNYQVSKCWDIAA